MVTIRALGVLLTQRLLLCGVLLFCQASSAYPAGGAGHFFIAKRAGEMLVQHPEADEIGDLLKDQANLNAFCNGAISPDLDCIVEEAHYGQTTRLVFALLQTAEQAGEEAYSLPQNDPARPGRIKEAEKAMCFALGWLSHCAVDLAMHPVVNARVGDAYDFTDATGKKTHAAAEVQFTHYLKETIAKPEDKITYDIPYWLVSKATGRTQRELEGSVKMMRGKIIGELGLAGNVEIPKAELAKTWQPVVQDSLVDTVQFVLNPESFKDWDLDCGRISSEAFKALRQQCIEINDGKLPSQWGRDYMNWWGQVEHLQPQPRHQRLVELIKGEQNYQPGRREVLVRMISSGWLRVNDKEITIGKNHIVQVPSNNILKFRVLGESVYRRQCMQPSFEGQNPQVFSQSPFELHYTSGTNYEHKTTLQEESYSWQAHAEGGKAFGTPYGSGVHPNIVNDVVEWQVPVIKRVPGMSSKSFIINIDCKSKWSQYDTYKRPPESI